MYLRILQNVRENYKNSASNDHHPTTPSTFISSWHPISTSTRRLEKLTEVILSEPRARELAPQMLNIVRRRAEKEDRLEMRHWFSRLGNGVHHLHQEHLLLKKLRLWIRNANDADLRVAITIATQKANSINAASLPRAIPEQKATIQDTTREPKRWNREI